MHNEEIRHRIDMMVRCKMLEITSGYLYEISDKIYTILHELGYKTDSVGIGYQLNVIFERMNEIRNIVEKLHEDDQ